MDANNPYRGPFQQGGGINGPFQPPNANGYIQPRPRPMQPRPAEKRPPAPVVSAGPVAPMPAQGDGQYVPQNAPGAVPGSLGAATGVPIGAPSGFNTASGGYGGAPGGASTTADVPVAAPNMPASGPNIPANAPNYIMGGYQPRPLTLPDPEALAAKLDMDAYHVIRIEYFSLRFEPVMTIKDGCVAFNNCCIRGLEDAVWIHFLIGDENDNTLIVRPRKEGTRGVVRWCIVKGDQRKSRTISCPPLTKKLYHRMKWREIYQYKLVGTRVPYKDEEIYVFFLNSAIPFTPGMVSPEGKRIPQRIVDSEEWADSYGLTVKELEASTQIDLEKGYTEELILPRERTFTRNSSKHDKNNAGTEETDVAEHYSGAAEKNGGADRYSGGMEKTGVADQIIMDDLTAPPGLDKQGGQTDDSGAAATTPDPQQLEHNTVVPANEEVFA